MDPLSVAASVAGLLSLTIQVSQLVYEQVNTLKNATKDAAKLLEELELLVRVLTSLKQFLASQESKEHLFEETSVFIKAIGGCNIQISAIKIKLDKLVGKQGIAQLIERGKWYYEHDEHQQLIQTLHRYIGMFQVSLSVEGM
jgi:Fungal N-terminal domain of STAND proteins